MGIPISEGGMELVKDMWSKERAKRRNDTLNKLAYLRWKEEHYEETADYAMEYFFRLLDIGDVEP